MSVARRHCSGTSSLTKDNDKVKEIRTFILVVGAMACLAAGCGGRKVVAQRDAQSYYDEAVRELEQKHYLKAGELFQRIVVNFPGSNLVDDAQFYAAETKFRAKDYTEAIFEYQRLIDDYPSSPYAETSHFQVALCYAAQSNRVSLDQTDTKKAISEFQRFIEDYPDGKLIQNARDELTKLRGKLAEKEIIIADNYMSWGYVESARIYYQRILDLYGDTRLVENARLGLALVKAGTGETEAALADLQQLLSSGTSSSVKKRAQEQIDELRKKHPAPRKELGSEPGSTDRPSGGGVRSHP